MRQVHLERLVRERTQALEEEIAQRQRLSQELADLTASLAQPAYRPPAAFPGQS